MAVIKRTNASQLVRNAVVLDLSDLGRQAEALLAAARAEAEEIRVAARSEAERLRAEAVEAGRAEGLAAGTEEGRAAGRVEGHAEAVAAVQPRLDAITAAWQASLDDWQRRRGEMLAAAQTDVLDLAFAVARKVVHRVVHQDPAVVADQLAAVLDLVARPTEVEVRINAADRALVEEVLPDLVARIGAAERVTLRDDATVGVGGCVVATAGGEIDARIETQLDRLADALLPRAAAPDDEAPA